MGQVAAPKSGNGSWAHPKSGLRVVALAGTGDETGLVDLDLKVVVLVAVVGVCGLEGEFVPGVSIGECLLQHGGDVIVGDENKASGLNGEHLQTEIAHIGLRGLGPALQELLIVGNAKTFF